MNSSEQDKIQQPLEILPSIENRAIELRFEGFPYIDIHKKLSQEYPTESVPHANTIRAWFGSAGKLKELYLAYAKSEGEVRHKHTQDIFKAHVTTAIQTLVTLLSSPSHMVRMLAAKEIINRQLGEPIKPVALIADERVTEYLAAAKKLDENIQTDVGRGESQSVPASV